MVQGELKSAYRENQEMGYGIDYIVISALLTELKRGGTPCV